MPSRASNQTGTLQFMAIDHESFFTSLYKRAFFIITINDGQASKKTSHGQVNCGNDEAISPLRKSNRYMYREAMTRHQYCL